MAADGREGGYIFLHRRLYSSPVWRSLTKGQRWVFLSVLSLANFKRQPLGYFAGDLVYVERGELAHEVEKIADHAEETYATARKAIEKLLTFGVVDVRWSFGANNRVRILRVVNYETYQSGAQQPRNEPDDDRATTAQQARNDRATREEGKKGTREEQSAAPGSGRMLQRWDERVAEAAPDLVELVRRAAEAGIGVEMHHRTGMALIGEMNGYAKAAGADASLAAVVAAGTRRAAGPSAPLAYFAGALREAAQRGQGPPAAIRGRAPVGKDWTGTITR